MIATTPGAIPLRERLTLREQWNSYRNEVMPKDAAAAQRQETQRAFYAGAQAIFALMTGGLDADSEPTDLDVAYVESLNQELRAFGRAVAKGTA